MVGFRVAPYMGAWIETIDAKPTSAHTLSLPTWGRGLKQAILALEESAQESLPTWGRGLKRVCGLFALVSRLSLPTWGRGLKRTKYEVVL